MTSRARRRFAGPLAAAAAGIVALAALAPGIADDTPENPRDVGLMERASSRLAQLDVTVSGPKGAIEGLTAADFEVRLNDKLVPDVIVDDLCVPTGARASAPAPAPASAAPAATTAPAPSPHGASATYLLYFDMPHLTQGGRKGAIDAARQMLPKLLAGGNRAMIVANALELKTIVPLTDDPKALDLALAKLVDDAKEFDPYAATEDGRLADITREMTNSVDAAVSLAQRYAAEERWRQERDLRRLSMVLGQLAEIDPPKAALYFADTMRQNAGEHYLSFFGETTIKNNNGVPTGDAAKILNGAATGVLPLDKVIDEASSYGVRFYTVEGQGIQGPSQFIESRGSPTTGGGGNAGNQAMPTVYTQRVRDAQTTLGSLAAETGGRAFLNGLNPARMAGQILDDMACVYLLSFDPRGFAQDKPLSVSVAVKRPKVKVSVRGRLVIQSDGARLTARVLSAFATPTAKGATAAVRVGVVPIAYKDGHFTARVQVAVGASAVPGATWDLGASLVSQGVVWQDGSSRIEVKQADVPVAFEKDMDFTPGAYELVAVAHEVTTDTLASQESHGEWPKLDAAPASIGPIAVSQPAKGGFVRNGSTATQGALVIPEGEPLRPGVATAIISLVCRARDQKAPLTVTRTLVGETETPVGTTKLDLTEDRCAQIVDLVPPKMLGGGSYRYIISVSGGGPEPVRAERSLLVPDTSPVPARAPAAPPPANEPPAGS